MVFDPTEPLFEQADLLAVVEGLRSPTLQQWISRGIISLSIPHPGKAANRKFSGLDVLAVAFVHHASRHSAINPGEAAQFVPKVKEAAQALVRAHPPKVDQTPVPVIRSPNWTLEWISEFQRVAEFYEYLKTTPKPINLDDINKKFGDVELKTRSHSQISLPADASETYKEFALFKNPKGCWLFVQIERDGVMLLPDIHITVRLDVWIARVINRLLDRFYQEKGKPQ